MDNNVAEEEIKKGLEDLANKMQQSIKADIRSKIIDIIEASIEESINNNFINELYKENILKEFSDTNIGSIIINNMENKPRSGDIVIDSLISDRDKLLGYLKGLIGTHFNDHINFISAISALELKTIELVGIPSSNIDAEGNITRQ